MLEIDALEGCHPDMAVLMGMALGSDFSVSRTHPLWQKQRPREICPEVNPVASTEACVGPALAKPAPAPRRKAPAIPLASYKCFMCRAITTYVSRTYSLLEDRWMAYVLVGCSCFTATYLCLKSEDMLPSPSSIFNL